MICEKPLMKGPMRGLPATGTKAGYRRHWKAGEKPCADCWEAAGGQGPPRAPGRRGSSFRLSVRYWDGCGAFRPVKVRCLGCGSKGKANPAVTGGRRTVTSCSQCRSVV